MDSILCSGQILRKLELCSSQLVNQKVYLISPDTKKIGLEKNFQEGGMQLDFADIHGNDAAKTRLAGAIKSEKFPHAVMIVGENGSGKRTLALEIAMALNCEKRAESAYPLPCGFCNTCRRIRDGNFTDIQYLRKQKTERTVMFT